MADNQEERVRWRDFRRMNEQLNREQECFRTTFENVRCLHEALENFKDAGNMIKIFIVNDETDTDYKAPYGLKRLCRLLGYDSPVFYPEEDISAYCCLLEALSKTEYPVRELSFGCRGTGPPYFCLMPAEGQFRSLRELHLTIDPRGDYPDVDADQQEKAMFLKFFMLFLRYITNLERFSLFVDRDSGHRGFHVDTFRALTRFRVHDSELGEEGKKLLRRLQCIELGGHSVELDLLLRFIGDRTETLRHIKLRHIRAHVQNYPDIEEHIRKAASREKENEVIVDIRYCHDGPAWIGDMVMRRGLSAKD